jgi:hypothetical protein
MNTRTGSHSTIDLVRQVFESFSGRQQGPLAPENLDSGSTELDEHRSAFIRGYLPTLNGPIPWLSKVEAAISTSVPEDIEAEDNEGQWLDADSAFNAINFLQNTADLLPGAPFIYGTPLGDFVAEFENGIAKLTSVVSAQSTLLVGVCVANPKESVQSRIPRGSNRLRDEVREFNMKMAAVHGEAMGSGR